jgi:hypothetical protein
MKTIHRKKHHILCSLVAILAWANAPLHELGTTEVPSSSVLQAGVIDHSIGRARLCTRSEVASSSVLQAGVVDHSIAYT